MNREILQRFIDENADRIARIVPGGLLDKEGKFILVCPIMERFNLDFSKVKLEDSVSETVVETKEVVEKPKKKRSKKKVSGE